MATKKKTVRSSNTSDLATPQTRTEEFLAKIAGLTDALPDGMFTRLERYLKVIADKEGSIESAQLPVILKQPLNANVAVGGTATFTVSVGGAGPFTYQWKYRPGYSATIENVSDAAGGKTNTISFTVSETHVKGNEYFCEITNANGTVISDRAVINEQFNLAPYFDSTHRYEFGEYCTRFGVLYRCTNPNGHAAGAWVAGDFSAVSVGGDIVSYLPTLFAPAGFGWGENLPGLNLNSSNDMDVSTTFPNTCTFRFSGASKPEHLPNITIDTSGFGVGMVISGGSTGTVKLIILAISEGSGTSTTERLFTRILTPSGQTAWKEFTLT